MIKFRILQHGLLVVLCIMFLLLTGCKSNTRDYENQALAESKEEKGDRFEPETDKQTELPSRPNRESPMVMSIDEWIIYFDEHPEERGQYTGGPIIPYATVEGNSTTGDSCE